MNTIKALGIPKIKALGLNNLQGLENLDKYLSIKYLSCDKDDKFIYLHFEVVAKKLRKGNAKVFVQEMNAINEFAVPPSNIKIVNEKNYLKARYPKDTEFDRYSWQDGFVFQATITCDGLSANTEEFKLKFSNQTKSNNICFCKRDFTVDEFKMIVKELRDSTFYNNKTITYFHQDKLFYLEPLLNENEKNNFQIVTWVVNQMFKKFKIDTCIRKINFLSQMYPETKYFTDLSENSPASNLDQYYGRGFIQLTHKGQEDFRTKNADSYLGYKKFSKLDVISEPDLLCKSLNIAADSGGWFWRYGKLLSDGSVKDLNTLADIDNVNEISRLVNGGENARKERLEANKQLKKIFKYENCINKK